MSCDLELQATSAIGSTASPVFTHQYTVMSTFLLRFYTDNYAPTTYGSSNLTKHSISQSQLQLSSAKCFIVLLQF